MSITASLEGSARSTAADSRLLLIAGAIAGPLYVGVGAIEAVVRDGFDITRHSLSLLANGNGGWIHMTMMVVTGLLTVAGSVGLARSMRAERSAGWAPRLIGLFGLGVAVAGLLTADPAFGFPPGTPDGMPVTVSAHGLGHLVAGSVGFLGLIVACLMMRRWFRKGGENAWATFSLITGVVYLVTFVGIATGGGSAITNIAFTIAVVLGWLWLTLLFRRAAQKNGLR